MEKILEYLGKLELSEIEAKLYITLLETGPISVRDIANIIKIKRTTTYLHIEQLMQKGLITKVTIGPKTQIAAVEPEISLGHLVQEKVDMAKNIQSKFPSVLQNIEETFPKMDTKGEAEMKYYKGKLGVRKIYEEALKAKELRSYANISEIEKVFPENFQLFDIAFKENPALKMFEICEDSPQTRKRSQDSMKNKGYFYKMFPTNIQITSTDILIYDGKVSIINLKDKISGVTLSDPDLYNNFKLLFDFNWNTLPEII